MTTQRQIDANKGNAQKSTGPRTDAGRSRSRGNALKHGLTAEQIVIGDEQGTQFNAFRDDVIEALAPVGAIEEQLAERIAICWWRLRRVYRMEAALAKGESKRLEDSLRKIGEKPRPGEVIEELLKGPFQNLSRYESMIERSLQRALHDLERWQARRSGEAVMAPIAVDVTIADGHGADPTPGETITSASNGSASLQSNAPNNVPQVRHRTRPT